MTLWELADKQETDIETIFHFARHHFGSSQDNADADYKEWLLGGTTPDYIQSMLAFRENRLQGHLP